MFSFSLFSVALPTVPAVAFCTRATIKSLAVNLKKNAVDLPFSVHRKVVHVVWLGRMWGGSTVAYCSSMF
ncbi:hypothetical protein GBAR_LOCUS10678 [Geodia barretti]|uniref:Secreted protein n=1 Tax=Geodia barretti TaxID=519541 RepID=A0AA35RWG4_GEOBA|nr:hypothetical protein GBAR_LOCUS10678 [Geodia barretti]